MPLSSHTLIPTIDTGEWSMLMPSVASPVMATFRMIHELFAVRPTFVDLTRNATLPADGPAEKKDDRPCPTKRHELFD